MYLKVISYIIKFSMITIIAFVFFRSFKSKNFVLKTILKQLFNYLTFVSNCMFSNDTFDFSFCIFICYTYTFSSPFRDKFEILEIEGSQSMLAPIPGDNQTLLI